MVQKKRMQCGAEEEERKKKKDESDRARLDDETELSAWARALCDAGLGQE